VSEPAFDEMRDATRRTRLANERTYLAWWRSGLTAFAVSFGAGRLVPELSGGSNWPFVAIGVGFAVVGVAFTAYGYVRHREVELALDRGEYVVLPNRAAMILAGFGVLLGLATLALLLLDPA
jgi:putative membrane protein